MGKIVGFEIGDHSVKLAYFAGNELKKAVCAELPDAMVSHGRILSMDAMADFLRDTARANGIPRAGAAVSLSLADAYTRDVTMPAMTEQQLSYNLPFEFHDFLTEEKSKYFFDYSVREVRKDAAGIPVEMDLFACAMLKERVEAYRAMFRRAGFKLKVLTPLECAYGALMAEHIRRTGAPEIGRCVVNLGHRVTRSTSCRAASAWVSGRSTWVWRIWTGSLPTSWTWRSMWPMNTSKTISTMYWKRSTPGNFTAVWRWRS